MDLAVATYSTAALAFAALTLVLAWRRSEVESYRSMILATACTTLWAAATALIAWSGGFHLTPANHLLEVVRSTAWLIFLGDALTGSTGRGRARRYIQIAVILSGSTVAALGLLPVVAPALARSLDANLVLIGYLALAILGLALTENLFRNVPSDARWNLKFLCFGIGALFGYDFFLYSQGLLFRQIDPDLFAARGITNALSVPLLIVSLQRSERAGRSFIISHRLAFHSAALLGTGLYLLLMAAAGYYIRQYGGSWGGVLQTVFLFGTAVVLVISLSSGTVRGYLKTFIGKHFFKYKYDYREEWLRFIRTISEAEQNVQLPERVIQAVCDIVDSPEGGLWLPQQHDRYQLKLAWNLSRWELRAHDIHLERQSSLIEFLARTQSIINVDVLRRDPGRYPGAELPEWLAATNRAWLIMPLIHHDALRGVLVLGQPRAPKDLDWEDYDLLRTVGQQAASYLAEYELSEALADARQFEAFNKRFAFVIHDVKNLVSRLSLIVSNAAKHRHDEAFQDDVIRTIEGSVDKMKRLLLQLHGQPGPGQMIELEQLLRSIIAAQGGRGPAIALEVKTPALVVKADEEHLRRVVGHMLQNAAEAAGQAGKIQVRLRSEGAMAVLEVEDDGPGMDPEFVRDKLFKPFKTTKGEGYGIGAYETQEFARASGGRLDVFSQPGRGTIMKMSLPLIRPAAP